MNKHNKKIIDGDNWDKENQKGFEKKRLAETKSGSIAYMEEKDRLTSYPERFHAHGETYLTPHNYGKNGREKINSFETVQEVCFYTNRLSAFREFVEKYTRKDINKWCGLIIEEAQSGDPVKTPQMIEQELKRLENISEEDFKKEDKGSQAVEGKELSVEEILNDSGFNKEIDKFFGLEKKPLRSCTFCSKTIDNFQYVCTNKKYFCNSDCMTGRKLERDTQNPFGENNQNSKNSASSFNNSLERQKSLGEIGQGLIGGGIGAIGLLLIVGLIKGKKLKSN